MSISHDNLSDRLLRYAPWTAAALVGVCVVALVARVVSYAGSRSEPVEIVASSDATVKGPQQTSASRPHVVQRPESAPTVEERTAPTAKSASRTVKPLRSTVTRMPPDPPSTPSAKSRMQMHTARRDKPADEPRRKVATNATPSTFIASSRSISAEAKVRVKEPDTSQSAWQGLNLRNKAGGNATAVDSRGYTSFFGIAADGQRFAYVLDRSASMGEPANKPLRAAKAELLASLEQLDSVQQFFLIFYNEDVRQFVPGAAGRHFADEANKTAARRFVDNVPAQGGTRHFEALQRAINLRPDVIFLLTDGEKKDDLSADELKRLNRLNGGLSQIHVIQFAAAPYADNSLVLLANENRGRHAYKNIHGSAESPSR